MRRTWPYVAGGCAIGAMVGVVIGGVRQSTDASPEIIPPVVASSTTEPTGTGPADTVITDPVTSDPGTSDPGTSGPGTSDTVEVTVAPSTTASTSTTVAATSTTAAASGTLPRDQVRLVVANGDGRFNLAGANANRLFAAGYVTIDLTDVFDGVPATILYFRPGFEDEARIVAEDILVPNAIIEPLPDTPITINDELGDVIVVLGPDALR